MKRSLMMMATLLVNAAAFAATPSQIAQEISKGIDCEVFLTPYVESALKDMSGKVVSDAGCWAAPQSNVALVARLTEIAGSMQVGEKMMFVAPASYGVLFTDGTVADESVYQHIRAVCTTIGKSKDSALIMKNLGDLKEVMRATFVQTKNGMQLVTNERGLHHGQQIWCKTPDGVISAVYHSEEEYLLSLNHAGFRCDEIKRPCFFGKVKYDAWIQQAGGKTLGSAYINNHPFTLYYVTKRA